MKARYWAAVLGVLAGAFASAAQAGISVNGISVNGISVNGISVNGISLNGISVNGTTSAKMKLKGVILQDGSTIGLR